MERDTPNQHLSLIPTQWSIVRRANHDSPEQAKAARQQLLERYGDAIQRYLRNALNDPHAADEVFQEFALQLVHGNLRGADPERGRFRYFVKGTLFHLIADYRRQQRDWPGPLPAGVAGLIPDHARGQDREGVVHDRAEPPVHPLRGRLSQVVIDKRRRTRRYAGRKSAFGQLHRHLRIGRHNCGSSAQQI